MGLDTSKVLIEAPFWEKFMHLKRNGKQNFTSSKRGYLLRLTLYGNEDVCFTFLNPAKSILLRNYYCETPELLYFKFSTYFYTNSVSLFTNNIKTTKLNYLLRIYGTKRLVIKHQIVLFLGSYSKIFPTLILKINTLMSLYFYLLNKIQ